MSSIAPDKFFDELIISNTQFLQMPSLKFGFNATSMMLTVDLEGPLEWSFTGHARHGRIYFYDKYASFDNLHNSEIWLRVPNGTPTKVRVWAWLRDK